jgi:histidinol-phosphate aminotransferase
MKPSLTRIAQSLPSTIPFVGPESIARQRGRAFTARLGANESGFGPAPSVIAAMSEAAAQSWAYGDPENYEVRAAIAAHLGLSSAHVSVGAGIDALLGLAVRLFAEAGDTVVSSLGGYPTFNYHVNGYGAVLKTVPYRDDHEDMEALLALAVREKAKIVYLANPDNPMGTWHRGEKVAAFAKALPPETLFILDEAYGETAPAGTLPDLSADMPNVLRFRTFSKAYGLAGARIAYAFGAPALISAFDKVRDHFAVSRMAQAAGIAALEDTAHLNAVLKKIAASRTEIEGIALENGLSALPSATNFVAIDCGRDGAFARRVLDGLIARDIFVRKPAAPALDRCIRVSSGPEKEMALFAEALKDVMNSLK